MTKAQAIKIIEPLIEYHLRRYAFGAGLFELGLDDHFTRRDYKQAQRVTEAWQTLTVERPVQLTLFQGGDAAQ